MSPNVCSPDMWTHSSRIQKEKRVKTRVSQKRLFNFSCAALFVVCSPYFGYKIRSRLKSMGSIILKKRRATGWGRASEWVASTSSAETYPAGKLLCDGEFGKCFVRCGVKLSMCSQDTDEMLNSSNLWHILLAGANSTSPPLLFIRSQDIFRDSLIKQYF